MLTILPPGGVPGELPGGRPGRGHDRPPPLGHEGHHTPGRRAAAHQDTVQVRHGDTCCETGARYICENISVRLQVHAALGRGVPAALHGARGAGQPRDRRVARRGEVPLARPHRDPALRQPRPGAAPCTFTEFHNHGTFSWFKGPYHFMAQRTFS